MESEFKIKVLAQETGIVLALSGELDLASSPVLEEELENAFSSDSKMVVIDLRDLEFMDSTGLSVLVQAHQQAQDAGRQLCLVKGRPQVQRLLTLTRVAERMWVIDTPEEALTQS